jgi:hypothetical protein
LESTVPMGLLYIPFCFPGTAVPGFYMTPLRDWIVVVPYSPRTESTFPEATGVQKGNRPDSWNLDGHCLCRLDQPRPAPATMA